MCFCLRASQARTSRSHSPRYWKSRWSRTGLKNSAHWRRYILRWFVDLNALKHSNWLIRLKIVLDYAHRALGKKETAVLCDLLLSSHRYCSHHSLSSSVPHNTCLRARQSTRRSSRQLRPNGSVWPGPQWQPCTWHKQLFVFGEEQLGAGRDQQKRCW